MKTARIHLYLLIITFSLLAQEALGAVYLVPEDEQMIRAADAIIVGTPTSAYSQFAANGDIVTHIRIRAESVLKGQLGRGSEVEIVELGGVVGPHAMGVGGGVRYERGERVLVFLQRRSDTRWSTYGMALGKFDFVSSREGRSALVRGNPVGDIDGFRSDGTRYFERLRAADDFLAFIQQVVHRAPKVLSRDDYELEATTAAQTASFLSISGSRGTLTPAAASHVPPSAYTEGPFRWDRFDQGRSVAFYTSGSQPGYDSAGAAQRAVAAWTNDAGSNIAYGIAGTTAAGFVQDGQNTIVFSSSTDVPSGAVGFAKWYANATHSYKGETFYSISEGDVAIRSNLSVSQKVFDEIVTHELGHTLGFRHSDVASPASNAAVMNSTVTGNYGATLGTWDQEAVSHVYGTSTVSAGRLRGDMNLDGRGDLIWRNRSNGQNAIWYMDGTTILGRASLLTVPDQNWKLAGTSDFNADGRQDIVWRSQATGYSVVWLMSGTTQIGSYDIAFTTEAWDLVSVFDFNDDAYGDLLWQNKVTGAMIIWLLQGPSAIGAYDLGNVDPAFKIVGTGDFNRDGHEDILFHNPATGQVVVWFMSGIQRASFASLGVLPLSWHIGAVSDLNGDGTPDIVLRETSGANLVWYMSGGTVASSASLPTEPDLSWDIVAPR